jgi:hypothetical protein
MKKTYITPAIDTTIEADMENLLAVSLGLTEEGGSVTLMNAEYSGEALAPEFDIFE